MEPENGDTDNRAAITDKTTTNENTTCPDVQEAALPDGAQKVESIATNQDGDQQKKASKKEEELLNMYKALAIKLKKELVKSREDFHKLREDTDEESKALKQRISALEESLKDEKDTNETKIASLEAKTKKLKEQLDSSESELQTLQTEFEDYKNRASKIMQETLGSTQLNLHKTFEDERYKQLKKLNQDLTDKLSSLELQLTKSTERQSELEQDAKASSSRCLEADEKLAEMKGLERKFESLSRENENLKIALTTFRSRLKDSSQPYDAIISNQYSSDPVPGINFKEGLTSTFGGHVNAKPQSNSDSTFHVNPNSNNLVSITNSKPTNLDEAENMISSLSDKIKVLEDEMRKLKTVSEHSASSQNMEYLKNIVLKFISLDSNQSEQKQRLVPVLSTVLRLTPDETSKLNSVANSDRQSLASSLFKFPLHAYQFN